MEKKEMLESMAAAIIEGDEDMAQEGAQNALDAGIGPLEALEQGFSKGMDVIGERFGTGEAFLPELLMAASAFNVAMEIIKPALESGQQQRRKLGTVVLATVKGDVHAIGKDIVATMMGISGLEVVDLGVDRSSLDIIEAAKKHHADIIALSSLMSTTMPYQKEVIDTLTEMKMRDKYVILVGGGPVSQQWANDIGADAYGDTAVAAVEAAKNLLNVRKQ